MGLALVPEKIYLFLFGEEFEGVRILVLYLLPGILAVAVANIIGHYFSATGQMNILIIKSSLGLAVTVVLLVLLLKKYGLVAACLTIDITYLVILAYLGTRFLKEVRKVKEGSGQ
jgi:O-antigen/teichoic acid export membrane protein